LHAHGEGLIDPCPLWDDDGSAYLVHAYAASRAGIKHRLRVRPMAPDGSRLLGHGEIVFFDPNKHPTIEGPKFLKRGGWYYILAPAGGVPRGWQVALRARSVYGPYEDRIVLEQGETEVNGPHQGALVDTADGGWWFIHFQDAGYLGRIAHLQPVTWRDDWPQMGADQDGNGVGEPVPSFRMPVPTTPTTMVTTAPQTSDEFDAPRLGRQWQWNANHEQHWSDLVSRPGWLRLLGQPAGDAPDLGLAPNLLLQKFPAAAFSVETLLDVSGLQQGHSAGLVVIGREHATLALGRDPTGLRLALSINNQPVFVTNEVSNSVRLRADVAAGGACSFSYAPANGGAFRAVTMPFQAQPGDWIGARAGLYCIAFDPTPLCYADFAHFRFGPPGDSER
jgi:beta-xylosidase